ncbi:MAG: hypothetical protein JWM68_983 [Verrucomicrobiales bacterium]|nr:hypothetical protein [Verrucomicrobiales bacterium]
MESHELLREIVQRHGAKEIAAKLDLSVQRVYQWADDPRGSGTTNPLDRVDQLVKATGDTRVAEWICERTGGFFMRNPQLEKNRSVALTTASNVLIQEFAAMITLIADAAVDGKITADETEDIRTRWEQIKSVSEHFVRCCEDGRFHQVYSAENGPGSKSR